MNQIITNALLIITNVLIARACFTKINTVFLKQP